MTVIRIAFILCARCHRQVNIAGPGRPPRYCDECQRAILDTDTSRQTTIDGLGFVQCVVCSGALSDRQTTTCGNACKQFLQRLRLKHEAQETTP